MAVRNEDYYSDDSASMTSVSVKFINTSAQGIFVKNREYVHLEIGNAADVWVSPF